MVHKAKEIKQGAIRWQLIVRMKVLTEEKVALLERLKEINAELDTILRKQKVMDRLVTKKKET